MSIKQRHFIERYSAQWDNFEAWLNYNDNKKLWRKQHGIEATPPAENNLPKTYRHICQHLAMAKSRMYSPLLIDRLNRLVLRGHEQLYGSRSYFLREIGRYFAVTFPALIRKEWKLVLLSALLFYVPFFAMITWLQFQPDMVFSVMDGDTVRGMEEMYDPELRERFGREREADSDVEMFGFYIRNNTGIDFRSFAGGLLFGIGTLFFTIFNGIFIGAAAGHLTQIGYGETFWSFVAGHSSLELTALVFSTAAGLKLAQALMMPGRKTRMRALIDNSKTGMLIMYGTATMTIMAAFVEAFWSSIAWTPFLLKYAVGIAMWFLVISYFVFVGRARAS